MNCRFSDHSPLRELRLSQGSLSTGRADTTFGVVHALENLEGHRQYKVKVSIEWEIDTSLTTPLPML